MSRYLRDFAVLGELGSGRYGRVWRAEGEIASRPGQPARRRQVAIKVLRTDTPPAALAALEQEWRLLDQVKHRAIVRVFAWWPEERAVVMEYVHGVQLRTVIDETTAKKEQIFTEAAIDIVCELGDALYQANTTLGDNGEPLHLVHRDLKPENILLTPSGELRILDFGLARARNADFAEDNDGMVRGTPVYMAPEQIRGEAVDHRTDLFALGLIFYELLTGRPAWSLPPGATSADTKALYARIARGDLAAECHQLESTLPGTGTIVARLLQANPRNRYANGQDLLVDLRRQLYRDRGASLKEFCDFFFGSIHPLPDPTVDPGPSMPSPPPPPATPSAGNEPDTGNIARAVPVRRPGRAVPMAAPSAPPVAPADAAPRPSPRIVQRPTPSKPEPDELPPSVRNSSGAGPRPRVIGARSPDETGMLPITPLSGSPDAPRAAADPSATAFFAISAPKATRPSGGPSSGPGAFVPPPVQPMPAAYAPPPAGGGVAGYGGAASAPSASPGNPFPVTETVRSTSSAAETRVQSQRVWAVVLGVMFLGGMAVLLVLAIILWNQFHQAAPAPAPVPTPVPTVATAEPTPPEPEPEPVVKTPTKSTGTKKATTTSTPSTPPPAPVAATGTLTVTFTGSPLPSTATLRCGDEGSFGRPAVSGGKVSFANVPTNGDCTLTPSSAFTYSAFRHMHGGRSYTCDVTNFQTSCN